MDFGANKAPVEIIREMHLMEHILETFILMLMERVQTVRERL